MASDRPQHSDDWLTVYQGDWIDVLRTLPAESVHCVVTSPPYWGLRDYGTATWEGGDEACEHLERSGGTGKSTLGEASGGHAISEAGQVRSTERSFVPARHECRKCGARRIDAQLGLEATPEEYVARLVEGFREVRRVLRADGTVWLNLGDSYANDGKWGGSSGGKHVEALHGQTGIGRQKVTTGLKPKDLVGIPWRVAFALQADGWYLRSDIIWSKPNPMPESVTDRPTKSHEYLFLLAKSQRYYFDADAVREGASTGIWPGIGPKHGTTDNHKSDYEPMAVNAGRNIRSVWQIATQPYPGAHFATFPRKLVEPCIKAGSPEGGTVLDPFAGSGTTGLVAQSLSRRAVLIDLNAEYLEQVMERNRDMPLGI